MAAISANTPVSSSPSPTAAGAKTDDGADVPNLPDNDIREMMMFYAQKNAFDTIQTLCSHYKVEYMMQARDMQLQMNVLHWFATFGNFIAVDEILKLPGGLDLMAHQDIHGRTPLHLSCTQGHIEIVQLFLAHGADIETVDGTGCTPVIIAAQLNHTLLTLYLIDLGANVDACDGNGCSIVHWAANRGAVQVLRILHKRGVALELYDDYGYTPLHRAILGKCYESVQYLLNEGNVSGKTKTRPPQAESGDQTRPLGPRELVAQVRITDRDSDNSVKLAQLSSSLDSWLDRDAKRSNTYFELIRVQLRKYSEQYLVHVVWLLAVLVTALTWFNVFYPFNGGISILDKIGISFYTVTISLLVLIQFRSKKAIVDPYHLREKNGPVTDSVPWQELPVASDLTQQYGMQATSQLVNANILADDIEEERKDTSEATPFLVSTDTDNSLAKLFVSNPRNDEFQLIRPKTRDERIDLLKQLSNHCCVEPKLNSAVAHAASQLLTVSKILCHSHIGSALHPPNQSQLTKFDPSLNIEVIPDDRVLRDDTALSEAAKCLMQRPLSHVERLLVDTLPLRNTGLRDSAICFTSEVPQPLRSKHDSVTDNRYRDFDHFCAWLGCVVCKSNHLGFLLFLPCHLIVNICWLYLLSSYFVSMWGQADTFLVFVFDILWYKGTPLFLFGLITHLPSVLMIGGLFWFHLSSAALSALLTNEMMNMVRYKYLKFNYFSYRPDSGTVVEKCLESLAFERENPKKEIENIVEAGGALMEKYGSPFATNNKWKNFQMFVGLAEPIRISVSASLLRYQRAVSLKALWSEIKAKLGKLTFDPIGESQTGNGLAQELFAAFTQGRSLKQVHESFVDSPVPEDDTTSTKESAPIVAL